MMELPARVAWAARTGASLSSPAGVQSPERDLTREQAMAGIETAVEAARRYIIKRPRLTRLLDNANARALMLIAPAGFGKTTLAREWVAERPHVWYRGTTAAADVAALLAGLSKSLSEVIPEAGVRAVNRMRATGTAEQDVDVLADLFAQDLTDWPEDTWLVFDDYQFAMEARAPERLIDLLLRKTSIRMVLTSRKRPTWATARRLLYGEVYELGRTDLAMDHDEAAEVLSHRKDAPAAGLVALAEGWPAVIGLAALTDDLDPPKGSLPDALYDYFAEELYQAASPEARDGLCRLALAPSLGHGVVDLLLGESGTAIVRQAARLGFLSTRSGMAEFHPLLRRFLLAKGLEEPRGRDSDRTRLARHFGSRGLWDDAFALVNSEFSSDLFETLFESGLQVMLDAARMPTVRSWVNLGRTMRIDAPIMDLAEAEISFHEGRRQVSEDLALRATRRLPRGHFMLSRAHYIAGMSAHLAHANRRARNHCDRAFNSALSLSSRRDAVWGQLNVALDLNEPDVDELLEKLIQLDDGSAISELRLAIARCQVAVRRGDLQNCGKYFASAENVVDRVSEPHARSCFYMMKSAFLALQGRYPAALEEAKRCEAYSRDARLAFALPYAKRVRAIAELGLRNFSRCGNLTDALERQAVRDENTFLLLEAQLIRARLLVSQGLHSRAMEALRYPPASFPFEAERAEFLATLALANACAGRGKLALQLVAKARRLSSAIEVRVLDQCVLGIIDLSTSAPGAREQATEAFRLARAVGNIDSYVTAYRGYPALLQSAVEEEALWDGLSKVLTDARDWNLIKGTALHASSKRQVPGRLSRRERQVLELVAQGLANKEIAAALFISEATAKVHIRHILEKLGVRTRTEAAVIAASADSDL